MSRVIRISSDRLNIDIAEPGYAYGGQRFDWTGFVLQAELDKTHTYCAYEDTIPMKGTGGIGLCGAFECMNEDNYDITPVGGHFINIGIGLVKKPDDAPYFFARGLPVAPFPTAINKLGKDAVRFEQVSGECNGFRYRYNKTLSVDGNVLFISSELQNIGIKPIHTREFNHNFICIDGHPIGPDYRLSLPYTPELDIKHGAFAVEPGRVSPEAFSSGSFFANIRNHGGALNHFWELAHLPTGASIRETGDFAVDRFDLWGRPHVISPEIFVKIGIEPGETFKWSRKYEFD